VNAFHLRGSRKDRTHRNAVVHAHAAAPASSEAIDKLLLLCFSNDMLSKSVAQVSEHIKLYVDKEIVKRVLTSIRVKPKPQRHRDDKYDELRATTRMFRHS
jgi:hypothetical protein